MEQLYDFLTAFVAYRTYILLVVLVIGTIIAVILTGTVITYLIHQVKNQQEEKERKDNLRITDYSTVDGNERARILREIVAPDSVDAGPNGYMVIQDAGKDVYLRTLTIVALPRRDKFATTFAGLLDFPGCTSSVFVKPISEETMIHKMDRQITVLSSEYGAASGDLNRQRKLRAQVSDASAFAEQVENGENRFFDVGFAFTLKANSIKELNKATQEFRSLALTKNIQVSNCYAVQSEAFLANGPFNRALITDSAMIKSEAIKYFQMDKKSVSALYNYTQSSYSHRNGIALGRDMFTTCPVIFDVFDQSHDGYTIVVAGKTGTGKSASIKMMACRQAVHGYHFVAVDSQARKGMSEGEYAALAQLCNGVNFQISASSSEVMNIFEISETTKTVKDGNNSVRETRSLELTDKITMVANVLSTMVRGGSDSSKITLQMETYINRILVDNLAQMYKSFGIVDGAPDSLYTTADSRLADFGNSLEITTGRIAKRLPTMTDFYKQLLISRKDNKDNNLVDSYNVILMALQDYVRELYYSDQTCRFFSRDEYAKLRYAEGTKGKVYQNDMHRTEHVIEIHGIRPYYDGQSSVHISKDCTFTNIDISQLPDSEKALARQIAIDFVNENFIKKNSESLGSSDKLECIFDEAHEMFNNEYARKTLDGVVRTARKRNVSIILSTQSIKEFDNSSETQAILKQAAVKFVFKQDYQDAEHLAKTLGLTNAQTNFIVNNLGGNTSDETDKNKHRGEVCIIDNKQVCFCKIDYRRRTESLPVETDAKGIEKLFTKTA